jgi:hypothetical protein
LPLSVLQVVGRVAHQCLHALEAGKREVTKGADQIGTYNKTEKHHRQFCQTCGGHVMSRLPAFGLIDVFSATIPDFPFRPQLHFHYAETVLPMRDGLPKLKDFPAELGGSGEIIAE